MRLERVLGIFALAISLGMAVVALSKYGAPTWRPKQILDAGTGPIVLTLHGIRTNGWWQDDLREPIRVAGFVCGTLKYGYFTTPRFLWSGSRQAQVRWFLDQYSRVQSEAHGRPISLIAHSFGTYLATEAMSMYAQIRFARIIFCGSIVRREFPWTEIVERGQVQTVLHDYGGRDLPTALVSWFVSDAGQSGQLGFEDVAGGRVIQRRLDQFRHSDFFHRLHYPDWMTFLAGGDVPIHKKLPPRRLNRRFALVASLGLCLGLLFLSLVVPKACTWRPAPRPKPTPLRSAKGSGLCESNCTLKALFPSWRARDAEIFRLAPLAGRGTSDDPTEYSIRLAGGNCYLIVAADGTVAGSRERTDVFVIEGADESMYFLGVPIPPLGGHHLTGVRIRAVAGDRYLGTDDTYGLISLSKNASAPKLFVAFFPGTNPGNGQLEVRLSTTSSGQYFGCAENQ